ncbi:MAG: hypothetical protein IKQ41_06010 [Clostridia bacterium]|nr:hypothetical protein [Clostridia bacterium]
MKRIPCLLLLIALTLWSFSAFASENAPASQFGFHGWPYRQSTGCAANSSAKSTALRRIDSRQPRGQSEEKTEDARETAARRSASTPTVSTGDYTTLSVSAQEQKLLNLVNQDRAANGLAPLAEDPALSALARLKSDDMNQGNYLAHQSPTLGSAAQMLTKHGYSFQGVGENIAHHRDVEKAEAAFMSSPGHRQNILGSQWTRIGIGVSVDQNGYVYATELFAR